MMCDVSTHRGGWRRDVVCLQRIILFHTFIKDMVCHRLLYLVNC